MGYKMKGSPAKLGTIQGTSSHKSALKTAMDDALIKGNAASPNKSWVGDLVKKVTKKKDKDTSSDQVTSSSDNARPSKKTKRLTKRYKNVKSKNEPKGHTTKRERRLEEKLHTSKKRDAMGPEERLTAKREKRAKIGDDLNTIFNYDPKQQKRSYEKGKAKSGKFNDFMRKWVDPKWEGGSSKSKSEGPELKVNKDLMQDPHKTKGGKWKTAAQHEKEFDKKQKATDTYELGDYSKGKSKFGK
jgi:hypothetical protein